MPSLSRWPRLPLLAQFLGRLGLCLLLAAFGVTTPPNQGLVRAAGSESEVPQEQLRPSAEIMHRNESRHELLGGRSEKASLVSDAEKLNPAMALNRQAPFFFAGHRLPNGCNAPLLC